MFNTLLNSFNLNIIAGDSEALAKYQTAKIRAISTKNGVFDSSKVDEINTIFNCKTILCNTISKLPLNILKNNKKYKEHKYWNLVHNSPNSYQTTNVFTSTLTGHLADYGNAFVKINKVNGVVSNLQIIHPSTLTGYELNEAGILTIIFGNKKILNEELLHFQTYSDDGIIGENPLKALERLLSINGQANATIDNYYKNGLHTSKVMRSQNNVDGKQYNQSQQEWAKTNTGSLNAGELVNLPFGSEIQELKLEFADAELIPTIKYNTSQIAALYGIPLFMLGIEANTYKSIEEALIFFQVQTIAPLAKIFKEELSRKLLTEKERNNEDISIEFNLNAMLAADSVTRSNYLKTLKDAAIISPNIAAQIEGYDEYEGGQYHYQQSQYQPLELIAKDGEFKPLTNGTTVNIGTNNNDNNK